MPFSHEQTSKVNGLSSKQAAIRLRSLGYNETPNQKARSLFTFLKEILSEPMIMLLVTGSFVYFLIGEAKDALVLSSMIVVIIAIDLVQERKAEKALEALKDISSPKTLVIRDGKPTLIPTREVVVGDVIVLKEGDRVAADAVVVEAVNIQVNESLLTGESVTVNKICYLGNELPKQPGGQNQAIVYAGTLIVRGKGLAQVIATGINSQMGKIGTSLLTIQEEKTPLQKEVKRMVKLFALFAFITCVIIVFGFGIGYGQWATGILSGITLSMTLLPEEFPVILTLFMTLGALRMSKKQVLTRNSKVIETLGAATILCVDKTGTLTENKMKLNTLVTAFETFDFNTNAISPIIKRLIKTAFLASSSDGYDPIEKAIIERNTSKNEQELELIEEIPFSIKTFSVSYVWKDTSNGTMFVATKGAPEYVLKLCNIKGDERKQWIEKLEKLAQSGHRVLAVAHAKVPKNTDYLDTGNISYEFLGLLGFVDPIKPYVSSAIKSCKRAGIRVAMITGDYPQTAMYVASQIGIENPEINITGQDLEKLSRSELLERVKNTNIYCRIIPTQKLRIIQLLKASGQVVAMTGDGINDAPALKAASIGVAMGKRGTDVARESSDLIILDDDFRTIVQGIRMGRRIYNNIKKAMAYVVAMHIPIAGLALLPVLFGLPVVLFPMHVAFLELIIDPACTTIFEGEKENDQVMNKPPRSPDESLFNRRTGIFSILQGLSLFIMVFTSYWLSLYVFKLDEASIRTATFLTLVVGNLALITTNRSWTKHIGELLFSKNIAYWIVISLAAAGLGVSIYIQEVRKFFHFGELTYDVIVISAMLGVFSIMFFELRKILIRTGISFFNAIR